MEMVAVVEMVIGVFCCRGEVSVAAVRGGFESCVWGLSVSSTTCDLPLESLSYLSLEYAS